jgi:hypothetical protein
MLVRSFENLAKEHRSQSYLKLAAGLKTVRNTQPEQLPFLIGGVLALFIHRWNNPFEQAANACMLGPL